MHYALLPLAKLVNVPKKKHVRFAEQSYGFLWYAAAFAFGVVSIFHVAFDQLD